MFDEIKKTKDPKLRKKQTEGVLKILEDTYGKKNARSVFKDFLQQEGISIQPQQKSSNVFRKFIKQEVTDIGKLKLSEVKTKIILVGSPKQKAKQKSRQKQLLITTQADLLSSGQTFFQPTKQAVKLAEKLGKKNAVNIIVGMKIGKRKTIGKNLPPFKAMKKAQKFVDKNIQASYLLKPTGKKSKIKDLKPFNASFKFRPSKRNALFQVERKRFRLDSPTEVRQLKAFRGKVSKSFFGKPKKRKK